MTKLDKVTGCCCCFIRGTAGVLGVLRCQPLQKAPGHRPLCPPSSGPGPCNRLTLPTPCPLVPLCSNPAPLGLVAFGAILFRYLRARGRPGGGSTKAVRGQALHTLALYLPPLPCLPCLPVRAGYTTALLQGANTAITEASAGQAAAA